MMLYYGFVICRAIIEYLECPKYYVYAKISEYIVIVTAIFGYIRTIILYVTGGGEVEVGVADRLLTPTFWGLGGEFSEPRKKINCFWLSVTNAFLDANHND